MHRYNFGTTVNIATLTIDGLLVVSIASVGALLPLALSQQQQPHQHCAHLTLLCDADRLHDLVCAADRHMGGLVEPQKGELARDGKGVLLAPCTCGCHASMLGQMPHVAVTAAAVDVQAGILALPDRWRVRAGPWWNG